MKIKLSIFCLLLLASFCLVSLKAQPPLKKLQNKLHQASDKTKLTIFNDLSERYLQKNIDSSYYYAERALKIATQLSDNKEKAKALNNLGKVYFYKKKYTQALIKFKQSIENAEKNDSSIKYNAIINCALTNKQLNQIEQEIAYYNQALEYIENNKKEKALILGYLGNAYYRNSNYNKSLDYYEQARNVYQHLKNKSKTAWIQEKTGGVYHSMGKYYTAIRYYEKALDYYKSTQNQKQIANTYINIGLSYQSLDRYETAIQYYKQALDISKEIYNSKGIAYALSHMAQISMIMRKFDKAIRFFNEALKTYKKINDKKAYAWTKANLASVYKNQEKYEKALNIYLESIQLQQEAGDFKEKIAQNYINIGDLHLLTDQYNKADDYFHQAKTIYKKLNNEPGIVKTNFYLAKNYLAQQQTNKAIGLLEKTLSKADTIDKNLLLSGIYLELSKAYKMQGNASLSLKYYEKHSQIKDILFNENTHKQLAELQTLYETEKKQRLIDQLNAKQRLQKTEIKQQKRLKLIFTIAFIVFLVFSILIALQYAKKNKAYKALVNKNNEMISAQDKINEYEIEKITNQNKKTNIYSDPAKKLILLMEEEKLYRMPDLTLSRLSDMMNTNRTYLSEIIHNELHTSFLDFIKEYRLKEAMQMLSSPENQNLTIESIANEVGFNSKSTFNYAFKKKTGVTPSFYRKASFENAC